jgi:hypothetical protein
MIWHCLHWNREVGYKLFVFKLERNWTESFHLEIAVFDFIIAYIIF